MSEDKIFYEILESRENRALIQEELINKYKASLISFTLNIPGIKKDSDKYRYIHDIGMEEIINRLHRKNYQVKYEKIYYKNTGPEGYIVVDADALELKKLTTEIEETHNLGRIFDIDVFDSNHNQISRRDLGEAPRKCLICDQDAKVCSKERTHSLEDLLEEIDELYKKAIKKHRI